MENLVQQKDLKVLVTDIVQKLLTNFEEKITKKIEHVIWERTGKLQDQLDSLMIENENIRERIRAKDKIIESLEERVQDNTNRSIEALKLANYNEQYSRKHNIRMVNYPEKKGEILRDEFANLDLLVSHTYCSYRTKRFQTFQCFSILP
jgi:predicted RNase H-like nuclease (RuvC/YqgF family)